MKILMIITKNIKKKIKSEKAQRRKKIQVQMKINILLKNMINQIMVNTPKENPKKKKLNLQVKVIVKMKVITTNESINIKRIRNQRQKVKKTRKEEKN